MIDNIANRNRPTFWLGCSWLIVNFQFREEFLRGFNCFCVSHSRVYLHEKQQLPGRRSPSPFTQSYWNIFFIYLSLIFVYTNWLTFRKWMRMLTHFPPGLLFAAFDKLNARIFVSISKWKQIQICWRMEQRSKVANFLIFAGDSAQTQLKKLMKTFEKCWKVPEEILMWRRSSN